MSELIHLYASFTQRTVLVLFKTQCRTGEEYHPHERPVLQLDGDLNIHCPRGKTSGQAHTTLHSDRDNLNALLNTEIVFLLQLVCSIATDTVLYFSSLYKLDYIVRIYLALNISASGNDVLVRKV